MQALSCIPKSPKSNFFDELLSHNPDIVDKLAGVESKEVTKHLTTSIKELERRRPR